MMFAKKQGSQKQLDTAKIQKIMSLGIVQPILEIGHGLTSKRLPMYHCLCFALIIQIALILRLDYWLFIHYKLDFFYPKGNIALGYRIVVTLSPFWFWGLFQVALKLKLIRKLTEVFTNSGLKTVMGKLPSFIYDRPIDEHTRRLRIGKSGQSLHKFETSKPEIESGLQVFIDEISENRQHNTVDIIYAHTPLDEVYEVKNFNNVYKGSFLIGKGRSKTFFGKLEDTPHLLVAGQTGMGKSTFLRQFITSLYLRNEGFAFDLIDLKGGLEFQIFENLPGVKVKSSVEASLAVLKVLSEDTIKKRMTLLKENNCKDISAFESLDEESIRLPDDSYKDLKLKRHIIIIDEAFDLFMVGPHASPADVKESRRHASKIAAQGRAVGVHLVIATQRPDRFALDPQTKANLTGKICFRLPNLASSMTVMDNKRAMELPNIKGRAIWQYSSKQFEIQTPIYTEDQATTALMSHYKGEKEKPKAHLETNNLEEENSHGV